LQTRFLTKYRHKDGRVVLKVTNDIECLKFASDNVADIKNIDRLSGWFLSQASKPETLAKRSAGGAVASSTS
jgi:signal recognition particle subunit SRP9